MKFSLFLHMERYDEAISHRQLYEELLALCDLAEEGGLHKVWIGEHHAMEYTISPNPIALLSAVAERTKRIRLGAGTFIAPFWHPIRMAGEAAMLDVISNGRAEIGLARGAYQFEFDRMLNGVSANDGGKYLREMVPVIRKLWEGDYAHDGEIWQFPVSTSVPKPVQSPTPPIWIAARDPDSHKFAVANGCSVMATPLFKGDDEVKDLARKFDEACAASPDVARPELMILQHAHVHTGDDDWQRAAEGISFFFRAFGAWAGNKKPPVNGFHHDIPDLNVEKFPDLAPDAVRRNMMVGKPEDIVARLKSYEAMGVDEYSIWVDNSLSYEEKRRSIQLFIDHVMPAFA
ncbi:LLM class flavin-dependent oxidoreductase [Sphingomonas carotinifaciens]|uniref:Flavin-dependent oxidoreductase, luciferase family (Includes alkanesulfonate monooxygenase SsuD and methylene tetrahydromethanopterin reductase) n=1 Tax=Sphingomonas carotinifaciens TaxID=1166323 RepID=A0A1G7M9D1_9SPHN|nr:LLM class flavin-dependent oxidoreductase [Sphingomonas carotinifaciens]MBB4086904.1 alkanesulfonate monooxygenase SsuD/methylene tetrahydromethanopterin reductase-like flavin-dependent oxidoreductase (luciferase family) [Sphingomonas carotinifaciens]MWC42105.1 LLM class flavin-dependent oxidoreductase [Sphingomonas carotinifaciens]SDF58226.1 Flavin-dependent oxidoreductase, luciferase family (includes alkanesulfonate monooxygenase SsuD and methylene tetrahydromethanopterin reductase) [Sphing